MKYLLVLLILLSSHITVTAQKEVEKDINFTNSIKEGSLIYEDFCMTCHLPNGNGVEKIVPPLANSDYLINKRLASIKAIKFGQKGEIVVNGINYNNVMAPLGLTDQEIADVMNYITNSWGNINKKMITVEEVSKIEE
jgi:mono/diheme cytochrome c family protein